MKKYLVAGAVAVMVFAFSAMAASLTVDGNVLQAGDNGSDLTCTSDVEVLDWAVNANGTQVTSVTIGGWDPACEGEQVSVSVNGNALTGNTTIGTAVTQVTVDLTSLTLAPEDVTALRVVIRTAA